MSSAWSRRARLKLNRPSLRRNARPPKQRTHVGADFTAANLPVALSLQHCVECSQVQYPPREVCSRCLGGQLEWRPTSGNGQLVAAIELHHSLWEFFKRRLRERAWPIANIRLDCGVTVVAHLDVSSFAKRAADIPASTPVQVFSHTDCSNNAVLIAVAGDTDIRTPALRRAVADRLGLTEAAVRPDGI